jgi:hypothetical protein
MKPYGKPVPNDWTPDLGYTRFTGCAPDSPLWRGYVRGAILGLGESWDATTGDAETAAETGFEIYESLDMDCDEYAPIDHNHDHGGLTGLADDDHPHYHTDVRGDARYSQLAHNHDAAYYTEAETNTLLAGKSNTDHNHAHNNLTGLTTGDPHTQYHNDVRGDARYAQLAANNLFSNTQTLRGAGPTLTLRDTDHRSAHLHLNGNYFHVLRGAGIDNPGWEAYNNQWPLLINLENNDLHLGGAAYRQGYELMAEGTIVGLSVDSSISNSAWTTIIFNQLGREYSSWVDWSGYAVLWLNRAGIYVVWSQFTFIPGGSSMNNVSVNLLLNGGDTGIYGQQRNVGTNNSTTVQAFGLLSATAGQSLQVRVLCTAGGSPSIQGYRSFLAAAYLGQGT